MSLLSLTSRLETARLHVGDSNLVLASSAILTISLVASFRQRIDQAVVRRFVVKSAQKVDQVALRWKEIDETNAAARPIWAAMVCAMLLAFSHGHYPAMPLVALFYPVVIVPLAVCTATMSSLSWVNPVAQLAFLAARLWIQDQPGSALSNCWLPFVLANFCWIELSLQSLSTTVMSHLGTALVLAVFNKFSTAPALLSLLALGFFCYRRAHPTQTKSSQMHDVVKQCSDLVCLVLQSGDELSEDTQDTLAQILSLTKFQKNTQRVASPGALSRAGTGVGNGNGVDAGCNGSNSNSGEDQFELSDSEGMIGRSPCSVDEDMELPDMALNSDDLSWIPPQWDQELLAEKDAGDNNAAWRWLLDNFADDQPPPVNTDSSPRIVKRARPNSDAPVRPAANEPDEPNSNWLNAHLERLVLMNFDAMAVEDTYSGNLIWANPAFKELACMAGTGDFLQGVSLLRRTFLQQLSHEQQRMHQIVTTSNASTMDIMSCSQAVGYDKNMRTLWVMSRSMPMSMEPTMPNPVHAQQQWVDAKPQMQAGAQAVFHLQPPTNPANMLAFSNSSKAQEFADIQIKVVSDPDAPPGPQGPRVQNMWRKYGQKVLKPGVGGFNFQSRTLDRLYYKCYQKDCKARLLVDVDNASQEQVQIHVKGEHSHEVPVLRVSWEQQQMQNQQQQQQIRYHDSNTPPKHPSPNTSPHVLDVDDLPPDPPFIQRPPSSPNSNQPAPAAAPSFLRFRRASAGGDEV
eukprot:TRINITY_DN75_c0_g1_i6.p1 TRINITY_DN75_c0_g1~~TRINITY_DN75_c0_g1_i6.p1  ORF type:complete len:741 (-),score=165.62 TRINITY_DN75_c0_g1_i6:136-2358(-)